MTRLFTLVACVAITLLAPATDAAAATQYNMLTAPDAVSRAVLSGPTVRFEDGATSNADIFGAINRNYPKIIEQNFARLNAADQTALLEKLSDVELQGIAQLYVNANANANRNGVLLLVAADRLDGTHLARLAKFFGYAPVYEAITKAAPVKGQSFAQHSSIVYPAPVAGNLSPLAFAARAGTSSLVTTTGVQMDSGGITPMQSGFKPAVSMTLEQLYTGFRTMQVGSWATSAAVYETLFYASGHLGKAASAGAAIGYGLTTVAQLYAPDWYYGSFVPAVGDSVSYLSQAVTSAIMYGTQSTSKLGQYQQAVAPVMAVPSIAQMTMEATGGDAGVEMPWYEFSGGGGGGSGCKVGEECHPVIR